MGVKLLSCRRYLVLRQVLVNVRLYIPPVTNMIENSLHRYGGQLSDELPDGDSYQGEGEVGRLPVPGVGVARDSSSQAVHH